MSVRDEKCLPLCESILKEIKVPVKDDDPLDFQTLERLARYQAETVAPEKGAQAWLRMADYYAPGAWYIPDGRLEAGRNYVAMGNRKKANELCELATKDAKDHVLGTAYWYWAQNLMHSGEHKQAQELLQIVQQQRKLVKQ